MYILVFLREAHLEVYGSVAVFVKNSKYLINENFCIAHWKDHRVHIKYFVFAQLPVRTIHLKHQFNGSIILIGNQIHAPCMILQSKTKAIN